MRGRRANEAGTQVMLSGKNLVWFLSPKPGIYPFSAVLELSTTIQLHTVSETHIIRHFVKFFWPRDLPRRFAQQEFGFVSGKYLKSVTTSTCQTNENIFFYLE